MNKVTEAQKFENISKLKKAVVEKYGVSEEKIGQSAWSYDGTEVRIIDENVYFSFNENEELETYSYEYEGGGTI
jgi:hypothetical protein